MKALWNAISDRIVSEPVMTMSLIKALIAVAVGFGLNWTGAQVALVVVLAESTLSWITRHQVTPVAAPILPMGTPVITTPPPPPDAVVAPAEEP